MATADEVESQIVPTAKGWANLKCQPCAAGTILSKLPKRWSRLILALEAADDIVWTVQPALSRFLVGTRRSKKRRVS